MSESNQPHPQNAWFWIGSACLLVGAALGGGYVRTTWGNESDTFRGPPHS